MIVSIDCERILVKFTIISNTRYNLLQTTKVNFTQLSTTKITNKC